MASDAPRSRIDQFFASRKRKSADKDGIQTIGGSPSAKGNLNSYLKSSQEFGSSGKKPFSADCSPGRRDTTKRSLNLDIPKSLNDEKARLPSAAQVLDFAGNGATHMAKQQGSFELSNAANGGSLPDHSISASGAENPELRQFANDFLSLYCRDLQTCPPTATDSQNHKRHGGPASLEKESKKLKEGNQITFQSKTIGAFVGMDGRTSHPAVCDTVADIKMHDSSSSSTEEPGSNDLIDHQLSKRIDNPIDLQATLGKCEKTRVSNADTTACSTPGSLLIKSCTEKTPKSICGTSISPGEGFWSEAIKLADGFCNPAAEGSCHLRTTTCNKEVALYDGESGVRFTEMRTLDNCTDDFNQKGSPFPVRHFDFSCEDKNLDVVSEDHDNSNGSEGANCSDEQSESGFPGSRGLQTTSKLIRCSKLQKIDKLYEKHEEVLITVTEGKPNISSQNDSIKSDSPVNLVKSFNGNTENVEAGTPSSLLQSKDWLDLSSWLPSDICNMYRKKGIQKLYQWQVDCLQVEGVLQRKNLVYCASTSAGKSFVAEILMLRRVLSTGKIAILVLPYVSICTEKAEHLDALLEPLGKNVRSYYGNQGGGSLPKDTSVAVCTIEKANSLINRLLEEGRLSEIGIIVIDELHMVGDQHRGYLLELLLTKLRYASGEGNSQSTSGESSSSSSGKTDPAQGMQIVGMSATMPNVAAVADWLQAALYQTEFRPVPLEEYIKVGNTIYNKNMESIRTISKSAELGGKDPDHIVELCNEVVQEGHSVLIFCSSRKGCESTAKHVSKFLKKFSANLRDDESELASITSAVDALRRSPAGLDPILEETLTSGVAYHHAGLTVEEREVVENCYRKGLVRVLTATSTLAAGVNLPARRVIFRQPRIGRDFIDGTRYKQMSGRAGRTGIDTKGESILICRPEEIKRIVALVGESCPPLNSCLSEDKNGMIHAILEVVAGGIVQTANDIHRYVRCTLLNSTKPFQDVVKSAQDSLRWLCHRKFLEWNEETKLYSTTPLGRAAFGSSLTPEDSLIVLEDLSRAREGFVLSSDLHLVYLVTPTNVEMEPDWELYYQRFMELSAIDQSVGNRVGVAEPFLMRMAHGAPMQKVDRSRGKTKGWNTKSNEFLGNSLPDEQATRVSKRFYVALILARLVQEVPVVEVCDAFKVARGMVQSLQENAGRFASMVSVFCERLGWHDLEGLVGKFQNRVSFGVRAEIVELTNIPYVKGSRARALYKAGLRSPLAIAEASVSDIARALFDSSSWAADESLAQKRMQLGVAKKIKNGARKIVLEKAEEARVTAFSTFQSLGIDVAQFPQPTISAANGIFTRKGVTKASIDVSTSSISGANSVEHVSTAAPVEGDKSSKKDASAGEMLRNASTTGLTTLGVCSYDVIPKVAHAKESSCPTDKDSHLASLRKLESSGDEINGFDDQKEHSVQKQLLLRENALSVSQDFSSDKGPINAINTPGGLDSFLDLWSSEKEFYFDVHYSKRKDMNSLVPFEIHGFAICWEHSPVFYINVPKDIFGAYKRKSNPLSTSSSADVTNSSPTECSDRVKRQWGRIVGILGKTGVRKFSWNFKVQAQVLRNCTVSLQKIGCANKAGKNTGLEIIDSSYLLLPPIDVRDAIDVSIAVWILWPDEEKSSNPNLEKVVKKRLSNEAAAAANRCGRWKNQMRKAAHDGCCRRVAQTRALWDALWKLLLHEKLSEPLFEIEMPMVNVVADMEMWGIGVDMEGCLHARKVLGEKLRCLEKEAHSLAGIKFSLYMTADIANVLYGHLKLPIPEGGGKGKQHPSTDKHCLDFLRNEHPIIPVIKEHRTLTKLLNSTLGSICSLARLSVRTQRYILHGHWLQTSTATGRLSMEEPNLQCVEHMVDFKMNKDKNGSDSVDGSYKINARDFITPTQENWLLLTADYSQIELRLMAHFSKDSALVELLSKPQGDVFTMIAAKWTGRPEGSIGSNERDQTKRMVYGILYGMGAKSLAEQLNCSYDEAAEKIKSFKNSFPAVDSWLQEAVSGCRQKGYVETLRGRRRFLSKINMGNSKEKSKAQRQAVNSICQGSAADIIKIAMINIHNVIVGVHGSDSVEEKFHMLKGRCRILLQIHDELVLEADPSVSKEAAELLKLSMENAASLRVPLRVKVHSGRTWGSLEPYQYENVENPVLFPNS